MDMATEASNIIIDMLGPGLGECERLWGSEGAAKALPINYMTGRAYGGINVLLLLNAAKGRGLKANAWLTYSQAVELGATVRDGARGVMCMLQVESCCRGCTGGRPVDTPQVHDGDVVSDRVDCVECDKSDLDAAHPRIVRAVWLFNVDDIDGLPQDLDRARYADRPVEGDSVLAPG